MNNTYQLHPDLLWQHTCEIDSTNSCLLKSEQPINKLLSADKQTQGRGRRQQQWFDEGRSALFSLSTACALDNDISAWPIQVAITVAQNLNALLTQHNHKSNHKNTTSVAIKWPNDLYLVGNNNDNNDNDTENNTGKFCGILVESTPFNEPLSDTKKHRKIVTGVGINLAPITTVTTVTTINDNQQLPYDYNIASIDLPVDKKELIIFLGNQLFLAWQQFVNNPQVSAKDYQSLDCLYNKQIIATDMHTGEQLIGIEQGINTNGHLLLLQDNKKIVALNKQQRIRFV